jgi:hypothetical protein
MGRVALVAGVTLSLVPLAVSFADPPYPNVSPSGIVNPAGANGPSDHVAFRTSTFGTCGGTAHS